MKNNLITSVRQSMKYWWLSLCIGILAIFLGILFITAAESALLTLSILFVIGFIASGLLEIIFAIANRNTPNYSWGWTLASGIVDLILGIILAASGPTLTIAVMIFFVGFYIMFRSIWSIGSAIELQKAGVGGWGWLLALAIVGVLFSILLIINPIIGSSFIVAFAAIAFITYGIFRIYYAFKVKTIKDKIEKLEDR